MKKLLSLSLSDKKQQVAENSKCNDGDKQEVISEEV
jgi:hypothetical protein